ncbi:MAG TPA: NAD(P)H-hydrate dehydratase [Magnetospirillaceae bacterium]|nr:NAD(P)H-hydrate dehydratase [Magnetospirillaceae bacterium]
MRSRPAILLSTREMAAADQAAIAAGTRGIELMEAAGWQVARLVRQHYTPRKTVILCGPGNNGGDGFVAARLLDRWGWPVKIALLGERGALKGDAALAAARWDGPVHPLTEDMLSGDPLVIDALFGAGLARPLEGSARAIIEKISERGLSMVAVDLPSGVNGDSGAVLGMAARAELTVTFVAAKPGHLLLPGRDLCGRVEVCEIGVGLPATAATFHNRPSLWIDKLPRPQTSGHKFSRGHLLVAGGADMTGAARLAARAGRRAGAGLTTLAAPTGLAEAYQQDAPGTLVKPLTAWPDLLSDHRINAVVLGPGLGVGEATRRLTLQALGASKACVLDADALTSFADNPLTLWFSRGSPVLTPHDGEYARLFRHQGDRLTRARAGAKESGATIVLKGSDTVVAGADGRAAIADNAPPDLATGGAGDVLAGLIGGLLAQGMPVFEAACAAVWIHGAAASFFGPGLVAEDLIDYLPRVLSKLREDDGRGSHRLV